MNVESRDAQEDRVNEAIAEYLEVVDAGRGPDPREFIMRHVDIAAELEAFFADRKQFGAFARPLLPAAEPQAVGSNAPTMAPGERDGDASLGTVRYFGDYELIEEIARGGMGVVFKARQVSLKRVVALKMILAGQFASDDDVRRFHTEAEAAARLDHPNIVPIFEVGQHDGQHFFSMGYVEGDSLAQQVLKGISPPREAAEMTRKIALAISFAHMEGVVHRDLKPANVLIDGQGQPRVTDFGLAKRVDRKVGQAFQPDVRLEGLTYADASLERLTCTGQVLGTPSYMPPEQATGSTKEIGPLSDVYSLGAILYCLLTGRPPFQATGRYRVVYTGNEAGFVQRTARWLKGATTATTVPQPRDRPYLRGWEWFYLRGRCNTDETDSQSWSAHAGPVLSLAYNTDGTTLASAGEDGTVKLWDAGGRENGGWTAHAGAVRSVGFRHDSKRLATAGDDGAVKIWEVATATEEATIDDQEHAVRTVGWSADGQHLAFAGDESTTKIKNLASGETIPLPHSGPVWGLAWSPKESRLATAAAWNGGIEVFVWDPRPDHGILNRSTQAGTGTLAWSPDGQWLAWPNTDHTVGVQSVERDRLKLVYLLAGHDETFHAVNFSPDGHRLATADDQGTIKIWVAETRPDAARIRAWEIYGQDVAPDVIGMRDPLLNLRASTQAVLTVAWSPDGRRIAAGCKDGTIRVWDSTEGHLLDQSER